MYEDLVRDLRYCAQVTGPLDCDKCQWRGTTYNDARDKDGAILDCEEQMKLEAADAIEKLAEFAEQFEESRFYLIRDGVLYTLKPNPPFPPGAKTWTLPPIEIKEDGNG